MQLNVSTSTGDVHRREAAVAHWLRRWTLTQRTRVLVLLQSVSVTGGVRKDIRPNKLHPSTRNISLYAERARASLRVEAVYDINMPHRETDIAIA